MRRAIAAIGVLLVVAFTAPAVLAADPVPHDGRVLVSINGPLDLPAGQAADVVFVANGDATIEGDVNTIVVVNGDATLTGAHAGTVAVLNGSAILESGTVVEGDVRTLNGQVQEAEGATVQGTVGGLEADLSALGVILVPAFVLFFLGLALVTVVAALAMAALAAKQTRAAEVLISRQPLPTLVAAVIGIVVLPLIGVLAMLTVVGAPIGLAFLLIVLPTAAYVGWLVAAIWLGDWILIQTRGAPEAERPYLAAVIGVIVLGVASLLPPISAIASLFGFGAVLLLGWKTFRHEPLVPQASARGAAPSPA